MASLSSRSQFPVLHAPPADHVSGGGLQGGLPLSVRQTPLALVIQRPLCRGVSITCRSRRRCPPARGLDGGPQPDTVVALADADSLHRDQSVLVGRHLAGLQPPLVGFKTGDGDPSDPSRVDMITGATISSRTVIRLINQKLESLQPLLNGAGEGASS